MIEVITPGYCRTEISYILEQVFSDFLGLPYRMQFTGNSNNYVLKSTTSSKEVHLPCIFLKNASITWLKDASFLHKPISYQKLPKVISSTKLTSDLLPLYFYEANTTTIISDNIVKLPFDIFGTVFYFLSCYEEAVTNKRDTHGRFISKYSLFDENTFNRPIVDEYVEILWKVINYLWPGVYKRKTTLYSTEVSCDIDYPIMPSSIYFSSAIKDITKSILINKDFRKAKTNINSYISATFKRNYSKDNYYQKIFWIMDVNEKAGNTVTFNILCSSLNCKYDNDYSLTSRYMVKIISEIQRRGHNIGFHPSYTSFNNYEKTHSELIHLTNILESHYQSADILYSRQHYLRWDSLITPSILEQLGIEYDSSLGFADRPGFRVGTCQPFYLYSLLERRPFKIKEKPLILMDCSVFSKNYMNADYTNNTLNYLQNLKDTCKSHNGCFSILWHNSHFQHAKDAEFYLKLI